MTQYIDKNALVAEIERRRKLVSDPILSGDDLMIGERNALFNLLSFIDTLEVKEVDLDEAARHYLLHEHLSPLNNILHQADLKTELQYHKDIETAFKAGFELGLKVQECNSKCKDLRDDGICNFATTKLGRTMRCENISCSRRNKTQKGE